MLKLIAVMAASLLLTPSNLKLPDSRVARSVRVRLWPHLQDELKDKALKPGSPLYIRIFKEEDDMEIWVKNGQRYQFFRSYNICFFSGGLGPKTRKGDLKSPEGFYTIQPSQLNPSSNYHLAMDIGYPNRVETAKGWTGDGIMIHGICASNGCYAMTNDGIDEIYTLVYEAFAAGQQKIHLDIYPFRMDNPHMEKYAHSSVIAFWKNLKPGYDWFQKSQLPAEVGVRKAFYTYGN
jgi:murein L,D-transpeptidase YafK